MSKILVILIVVYLVGCASVTIRPNGNEKIDSPPDYENVRPLYFYRIFGEVHVNVKKICGKKQVRQMQSLMTFKDELMGFITLFFYSPITVRVWCGE